MDAIFLTTAAIGVLFLGGGLLVGLVEEVLGPIWEEWRGTDSGPEDPSREGEG